MRYPGLSSHHGAIAARSRLRAAGSAGSAGRGSGARPGLRVSSLMPVRTRRLQRRAGTRPSAGPGRRSCRRWSAPHGARSRCRRQSPLRRCPAAMHLPAVPRRPPARAAVWPASGSRQWRYPVPAPCTARLRGACLRAAATAGESKGPGPGRRSAAGPACAPAPGPARRACGRRRAAAVASAGGAPPGWSCTGRRRRCAPAANGWPAGRPGCRAGAGCCGRSSGPGTSRCAPVPTGAGSAPGHRARPDHGRPGRPRRRQK